MRFQLKASPLFWRLINCTHNWRHIRNEKLICRDCKKDVGPYVAVLSCRKHVVHLLGGSDALSSWDVSLLRCLEKQEKFFEELRENLDENRRD